MLVTVDNVWMANLSWFDVELLADIQEDNVKDSHILNAY